MPGLAKVVFVAETAEAAEDISRGVLAAWPSAASPPEVGHVGFSEVDGLVLGDLGSLVVRTSASCAGGWLVALADRLDEAGVPGLEIADGAGRLPASEGWLVRDAGDAPGVIAATLEAQLATRGEIGLLRRELDLARRSQLDAVDEMARLSDEMRLASSVQRSLIPAGDLSSSWCDAAVLFRPATFVSGDIYDVREINESTTGFFVADAVGHGVPAALLTMVISRSLHMKWRVGDQPDLSMVMQRLNRELCEISGVSGRFATVVVGIIDREKGSLSIVNAGHPPPIIETPGGQHEIDATGPLVGVFEEAEFDVETREFGPGSSVVVYSDGFETAFGARREEGGRRLPTTKHIDVMRSVASCTDGAVQAIQALESSLDSVAGSLVQDDDLTALTLRRVA